MCGIFGVFSRKNEINQENLVKATELLYHRGPDNMSTDTGEVSGIYYGISHTRLSIIDLSSVSNQPMFSTNKDYIISFNGEIYNYREIKNALKEIGYEFLTGSDTEVILNGYIEWGADIVYKLDGMFAFIIIDKVRDLVYFARDQLGIKPLYYHIDGNDTLYISSEIKSFTAFENISLDISREYLGEYLANLWVAEPNTLFKGVYKLSAGYRGFYNKSGFKTECYWDLPFEIENESISEEEALEKISTLFESACEKQLVSDVPIGIYVSGGVDSSAIVSMVTKKTSNTLKGLIAGFNESDQKYEGTTSDLTYARQLLKKYPNIDANELIMEPGIINYYKELIWYLDEPIADPAIIPSYLLAKKSRELGCKVMLSGMGGDEVFCGYNRFSLINKAEKIPKSLGGFFKVVANTINHLSLSGKYKKLIRDIKRASFFISNPNSIGYQSLIGYFDIDTISKLLGDRSWIINYKEKYNLERNNYPETLKKYLYYDYKGFLASHNLIYSDKASMAASVEVRVPFLDKDLVEYVWSLDSKFLMKNNITKYPLKKSLEGIIDNDILYRPKAGFSLPIRRWLNKEIKEEVLSCLTNKSSSMYNYIDYSVVEWILKEHYEKGEDKAMEIWTLYTLCLWINTFNIGKVS